MTNEEEQLLEETEETPADESETTEEDVSADENSETAFRAGKGRAPR